MKDLPNYRLAIKLSGVDLVGYRFYEEIQRTIYSKILRGTILGEKIHKDRFSLFTFSLLADDPSFQKDGIRSKNKLWTFRISSAYKDLLILAEHFFSYFTVEMLELMENKYFRISGVHQEPLLERNIFQSLPILVTNKSKQFLSPDKEEFFTAIKEGLFNRYEFFNNERPCSNSIKSIGFTQNPRQKLISYKERNLLSFAGSIKLVGDKELIQFAQCVGLGQMPSAGLGMLI